MLAPFIQNAFPKQIASRGRQYHADDAVNVRRVTSTLVEATIKGSDRYTATIALERRPRSIELVCSCSCPHCAIEGNLCKHLFALFLEVDAVYPHFLIGLPASTLLTVQPDEDIDEFGDFDVDDEPTTLPPIRRADGFVSTRATPLAALVPPIPPPVPKLPWQKFIDAASVAAGIAGQRDNASSGTMSPAAAITPIYLLCTNAIGVPDGCVALGIYREELQDGALHINRSPLRLQHGLLPAFAGEDHQAIAAHLTGRGARIGSRHSYEPPPEARFFLDPHDPAVRTLLRDMSATGRLRGTFESIDYFRSTFPLTWIDGPPWRGVVTIAPPPPPAQGSRSRKSPLPSDPADPLLRVAVALTRDGERREISKGSLLVAGGTLLIENQTIQHVDMRDLVAWDRAQGQTRGPLTLNKSELPTFLRAAENTIGLPLLDLAPEAGITRLDPVPPAPRIELKLNTNRVNGGGSSNSRGGILGSISVLYGPHAVDPRRHSGTSLVDGATKLLPRDPDAESRFVRRAMELGLRPDTSESTYTLAIKRLPEVVAALLADGWTVLGDRALYRRPGQTSLKIAPSGLDWFGITGGVMFDGQQVPFPTLLDAVKSGNRFVKLGDGSLGMLPDDWLKRHAGWMRLGYNTGVDIRFSQAQIGLIDALLAEMPEATCDAQVAAARDRLHSFDGLRPVQEPASFIGELRPYQREGLGWLDYLNTFGFGGCLADDMGLGKTVQLLAHVAALKERGQITLTEPSARAKALNLPTPSRAWLIVAPRSLIYNWIREAQRFTPSLKVLDFAGPTRARLKAELAAADLVFTTYGLLRTDIELLRGFEFAGVVLDEAQAIKNPQSASAKAAGLLKTRHRIAMTGTPVENHLGDLWSIFEFLNPGLLGALPAFRAVLDPKPPAGSLAQLDPIAAALDAAHSLAASPAPPASATPAADLALIRSAVRPFILRRTKQQVAADLPSRTEQTIECVLRPEQRTLYSELAAHYRESILGRVDRDGMNKSRMHVLEALLRLRQAACHPALINPAHASAGSAKIESLLAMLEEATDTGTSVDTPIVAPTSVAPRGHKALVFSQFTSMLALVKTALDSRGVRYEYLDGQTKDRAARVDRFQSDPDLRVFLISLKAGGSGLNLTAAEYVFILDPWWNPAVEAQAIDRAHRLGQTKNVFAYRLIAKDTIEERIADLQRTKRELAKAIMDEDAAHSLAASLTRDDLAALFQ